MGGLVVRYGASGTDMGENGTVLGKWRTLMGAVLQIPEKIPVDWLVYRGWRPSNGLDWPTKQDVCGVCAGRLWGGG